VLVKERMAADCGEEEARVWTGALSLLHQELCVVTSVPEVIKTFQIASIVM